MRLRLAALLIFVLPMLGVIVSQDTGAPPSVVCTDNGFPDSFGTAGDWGDGEKWWGGRDIDETNCPKTITGVLRYDSDHNNACKNTEPGVILDTAESSVDMYACVTYVTNFRNANGPGLVLRTASQTANADQYQVFAQEGSTTAQWGAADFGADIGSCTIPTFNEGDTLCAAVEGTGSSTTMRFWHTPGAGDPDDWGDPSCCIADTTATSYGSTTCVADTRLDWTAPAITDTGLFQGMRIRFANTNTTDWIELDDYLGGSCE
jgi:hypothetical protein